MTFDLVLVGFGNVARRFVRLLEEIEKPLARDHDIAVRIVGVATRTRGQRYDRKGVDGRVLADTVEAGGRVGGDGTSRAFLTTALAGSAAAARAGRLVVVETTTLDIKRGEPAIQHVRQALRGGAHVVTANKGPAAFAYRSLAEAARRAERAFFFESAVMDGIPILNLYRETLPAATVTSFRGVVNSTTNYMLTAMEQGEPFDAALSAMQRAGIAEADPSLDVDGWDAAAKASILANVLLGASMTPQRVEREGLTAATAARARAARSAGRRLKLVAAAERVKGKVHARVSLAELPADDPLAQLEGPQNAILFQTDMLGEIAVVQRGSGLIATAYGLVSDLVTIARRIN